MAEALGACAGVAGNASRAWAAANRATLVAFIRAWRQAVAWLVAPENRAEAVALFRARMGGSPDAVMAKAAAALLLDPVRGLRRDLSIAARDLDTSFLEQSKDAGWPGPALVRGGAAW
jgi:ABC-type nitrate/sulfonate/bicarbonate transport system substrate-binding protein